MTQKQKKRIRKTSGHFEPFDAEKTIRSLQRAGASKKLAREIAEKIRVHKPRSTKQIHELAIKLLHATHPPLAARYNLKRALTDLGPAGFPFEQFVAHLFKEQGYNVKTNQLVPGYCVTHETDILAEKDGAHFMVECKFHGKLRLKSNVKVPLYIHARFEDISQAWDRDHKHHHKIHQGWIFTNTHFTSEAIKYAECRNIRLTGWSYPIGDNLARMIDRLSLHPITALTSLSPRQKKQLIKHKLILCRDITSHRNTLSAIGLSRDEIMQITEESKGICALDSTE